MNDPGEPSNPLQGLLGDLLKMLGSSATPGGATWLDSARSLAQSVAAEGTSEPNPDPLARMKLEELARVAELHVGEATGLAVGSGEHPITFAPVTRGTYAVRALEAYQPLVQKMIASQGAPPTGPPDFSGLTGSMFGLGEGADLGNGLQEILGRFAVTMGPVLVGLQFGSAAGHLAKRALGQYALPIPWPPSDELLVVTENIAAFAADWSLPVDETELWVCVRELTTHVVLSRPHVAARFSALLEESARQSVQAQQSLTERLTGGDDEAGLEQIMSDPEALLADLLTPGRRNTSAQLTALTTALGGYVDHVTAQVAARLTGSSPVLTEAWYRYRVEDAKGDQAAATLFGLDIGRAEVDRGAAFVRGLVERAGEDELVRLWSEEANLPTPAEVDAPGLWLERINLPGD